MNDWLERHRILVLAPIFLLIAALLAVVALRWREPASIVINPPAPSPTPGLIQVYVSGAVARPDVYTLEHASIVRDAVDAAGGPAHDADLNSINLAEAVDDGDQIHVPRIGEQPTSPPAAVDQGSEAPVITGPININTATQAELETLPGIGPALAQSIIEYRDAHGPFATIEAIQNVSGIGPAKFDGIKDLITVGD